MNYFEIRYCFYTLLAITITLYFISDILVHKTQDYITTIGSYIEKNNIFDIPFIKVAYDEFKDNPTVRKYINNYNYLVSKKEKYHLSKAEEGVFQTLQKDIELLKISFLTTIVLDNEERFDDELTQDVKKFISIIKKVQIIKFIKIILTIPCIVLFIKIVF